MASESLVPWQAPASPYTKPWATHPPGQLVQNQREAFLKEYALTANISRSCQISGAARSSVYFMLDRDPDFKLAMQEAEAAAIERLEQEAYRRAHDGVTQTRGVYFKGQKVDQYTMTEYSDTLLLALLKANRPDKYKERLSVESASIVKVYSGVDIDEL